MESTFKEEITDKLAQILESVEVIEERCKSYQNIDDFLQTPWGMTILDACILRLQVIGETIKAIDDIWTVIRKHLPPLKETILLIKEEL